MLFWEKSHGFSWPWIWQEFLMSVSWNLLDTLWLLGTHYHQIQANSNIYYMCVLSKLIKHVFLCIFLNNLCFTSLILPVTSFFLIFWVLLLPLYNVSSLINLCCSLFLNLPLSKHLLIINLKGVRMARWTELQGLCRWTYLEMVRSPLNVFGTILWAGVLDRMKGNQTASWH